MKQRVIWVLGLFVALAVGAALGAQGIQIVRPGGPEHVLSGSDIGFKVEGEGRDGAVKGRFMVKVDGAWKEIELAPRFRLVR